MACRTLWRLGELCATCGAADMAALGYARAPPRGGAMADARTVQAQDAQEPRAMSGWIIAIALSVLTGAAIIRFGRIPRSAWELVASALLVGLAGYAWQGNPSRSEEHTSELQSLMRISYAVFCLQ